MCMFAGRESFQINCSLCGSVYFGLFFAVDCNQSEIWWGTCTASDFYHVNHTHSVHILTYKI